MTDEPTERLARVYSSHARGYAEGWSPVISVIGARLLEALPLRESKRIVDVGTGAGAHLPDIRRLAPSAWVLGVDRSPGMLELARVHGSPLALMDATRLGVRDGSIDVAVLVLVLFHLDDPVDALRGVRRALRPGGAVGTVTWANDPDVEAAQLWEQELDALGATDPTPIPRRREGFLDTPEKIAALFSAARLVPVKVWIEGIEHAWSIDTLSTVLTSYGRTKRKLESLPPDVRAAFGRRIAERFSKLDARAFLYRAAAVCGIARRSD